MALPSQSARSQTVSGRSFSSRRRRRTKNGGLLVLGGAALALALLIYGGLWVFGVVGGGDGPAETETAAGDESGITDPIGAGPRVIEQGRPLADRGRTLDDDSSPPSLLPEPGPSGGQTGDAGTQTNAPAERETAERRNILREGLENARNGGGSPGSVPSVAPGEDRTKDGEVLATNTGGVPTGATGAVAARIAEADRLLRNNEPLEARRVLNEALKSPRLGAAEAATLRTRLGALNADLVFSPRVVEGDTLSEAYVVQGGDALSRIASRRELATHWKLIQRINGLSNPNAIRQGQTLKLVRGPFHAVVDKSDYRVDVYHGAPNSPDNWMYIRSFDVGLGKDDGTPLGTFVVGRDSKVENPAWVNPHDPSERYGSGDPMNPIGKHWIGLEGIGDSAAFTGYGLHGTIDPDSIGSQASLGCVRLRGEDIALVYELLEEGISVVKIVP